MNFMMACVHRSLRTGRIVLGAVAVVFAIAVAEDASARNAAQSVPNAMQGFSENRDQPIQIEAVSLEMRDKKKQATFSVNVKVVQGDTTMTSKSLVVLYDQNTAADVPAGKPRAKTVPIKSATPGPGGSSSIRWLEAKGSVVVTRYWPVLGRNRPMWISKPANCFCTLFVLIIG
jgi:lipopolysaccharide export system protein LptA